MCPIDGSLSLRGMAKEEGEHMKIVKLATRLTYQPEDTAPDTLPTPILDEEELIRVIEANRLSEFAPPINYRPVNKGTLLQG